MFLKISKKSLFLLFLGFMVIPLPSYCEEVAEIEAVSLIYIPEEHKVVGEGDVCIKHRDFNIRADKVIYLVEEGEIFAEAVLGRKVEISRNGYKLYGDSLYYNLFENKGFMTGAESSANGVNLKGDRLEFYMTDEVPPKKFLFFRSSPKKLKKPAFEFSMVNGRFTTCKLYRPSYYVIGSKIILYPDRSIRIVKPTIFIGEERFLTFPFDYTFSIERREFSFVAPVLGFTSTLGWYGGFSFRNASTDFPFSITLLYSEKQDLVGKASGGFGLYDNWRFYFDLERSEEWQDEKLKWRTLLRLAKISKDLDISLSYIKNRKLWVLRDDADIKAVYSAVPELYFKYSVKPFVLFARWGDYEEGGLREGKLTLGGAINLSEKIKENIVFDSTLVYLKDYYESEYEREILYHEEILKWSVGMFTVVGGYLERKVSGETPFYFDKYEVLRKYLVGVEYSSDMAKLKNYFYYDDFKDNWRDFIGEFSLNLGARVYFSIKPWYYLDEGNWREIDYNIVYYLCPCGCTSLELTFHDDLRKENDDVLWLKFYISSAAFSLVSGSLPEKDSLIPR
ncbi:MAG: hypothetical protein PWQ16_684 [bacterium]|nr:hypothetical protein [bacterium]